MAARLTPNKPGYRRYDLRPCGTLAAYKRHQRRGEPIDETCRQANARACADRKASRVRAS